MKGSLLLIVLACFALVSCTPSGKEGNTPPPLSVSGGKSATIVLETLAKATEQSRPSGTLGVFASVYLAQGLFFPTEAAQRALNDIILIVHGQEQPLNDESYALLQTLGDILSVDIIDVLNRSPNRVETLDRYGESLANSIAATKRKLDEIKAALGVLATQKKEQRTEVRDLERAQKDAIAAKDYSLAAEKEQELLRKRSTLSETELNETQTKDMQSRLKKLLDIAEKRKLAIDKNRQILLSGLTVSDLPGLTDLGLVEKSTTVR